ncbi:MAG: VWA domain-containing protein [Candidatus Aminicenantes bacterium]|nr:VWA domain-containing protein [Candidatus Aminicenantes bacterium]
MNRTAPDRRRPNVFAAVLLMALPLGLIAQTKSVTLQKIDLSLLPRVQLYLTVTDEKGRSLLGLTEPEIQVGVDGQAQKIASLKSALSEGQSLSVVLVIDRSGSMTKAMSEVRRAAVEFVRRLSLQDEAAVISFDDAVSLEAGFTRDRAPVEQAIAGIKLGRDTALYDAVQEGLNRLRTAGLQRQAVVILSDGKDNRSRRTLAEVLSEANNSSVPLFTIGLGPGIDEAGLRELAGKTGGGFFKAAAAKDLWQLYQTIAEQLTNQYLLSFDLKEGQDEKWHSLEILLRAPAGGGASTVKSFIASLGPGVSRGTLERLEKTVKKAGLIQTALLGGAAGLLPGALILLVIGLARRGQRLPLVAGLALLLSFILLGAVLGTILFSGG